MADPYSPTAPTHIARRFDEDREIPEERFRAILVQVLEAPESRAVAKQISKRLGRPLEPFDLWYTGFQPRGSYSEEYLIILMKNIPRSRISKMTSPIS